jgi:DNA repair exonuclease SbcCD ATPase subunit
MAKGRKMMTDWVIEALKELGGKGKIIAISELVWEGHEADIRAERELLHEWQYELRWAGDILRKNGTLKPASATSRGIWELATNHSKPASEPKKASTLGKLSFPKFKRIVFRDFSLYTKNGRNQLIDESIGEGVYCLAGANGLGKTTFLNAVNYCLTGIVLEPFREVLSPGEIVKANKEFTESYFVGRIKEKDRKAAEIEITFVVNDKFYRIIRPFFGRDQLRALEIYEEIDNKKIGLFDPGDKSPRELNTSYESLLSREMGFEGFEYFIFYQLYLLTFDENRRMVFWDERASQHMMGLAFNTSSHDAERMIQLKRSIEKHESAGRNSRWDATQTKKKIDEILSVSTKKRGKSIEKLEREYHDLYAASEKAEQIKNHVRNEYDTLLRTQSKLTAEIAQLRMEQAKYFSNYSKPRSKLLDNTSIKTAIANQECLLCSSAGSKITEMIKRNILKERCPLCETKINEEGKQVQAGLLALIRKNDAALAKKNGNLNELIGEANGKALELQKADLAYEHSKEKIQEFEKDNSSLNLMRPDKGNVNSILGELERQFAVFDKASKESYEKRDKLKPEYEALLKATERAYRAAETEFVPIFKRLATSFIGLNLSIRPQRSARNIGLVMELQDSARTRSYQLSESQRFFLDIALRMSLAIYLSKRGQEATMIIDTPEGSLDIAYESRVGTMFAEFVNDYHQRIIMTANINNSELLVTLAKKCGKEKMRFRRMLAWTELGPVQKQGEKLFQRVYRNIERALG